MIGKLTGSVDSFYEGFFILMTASGVGYRVFCSLKTLAKQPPVGGQTSVFIEMEVREDHIRLFGFADKTEQDMFCVLTGVQGVGAKMALGILSVLSPQEIHMALATGDAKAFTRVSGVGPKLASRLITELKGKTVIPMDMPVLSTSQQAPALAEAVSALENLGYGRSEAGMVVGKILQETPDLGVSAVIKMALKELAPHV